LNVNFLWGNPIRLPHFTSVYEKFLEASSKMLDHVLLKEH